MAYSEKVIEHYENPRNVGSFDKSDTGPLFVTLAVEIFEIPTVSRCPIQKGYLRGESKVFDLSCQKAYLFIVCQNERFSKVKSLHNT